MRGWNLPLHSRRYFRSPALLWSENSTFCVTLTSRHPPSRCSHCALLAPRSCWFCRPDLMGGTLPVRVAAVARKIEELGVRAGRLYAVNTAGAVAGTLTAGFLLIPSVGLRNTLFVAVALNLLAGLLAWRIG